MSVSNIHRNATTNSDDVLNVLTALWNGMPNVSCHRHDNGVENVLIVSNFVIDKLFKVELESRGISVHGVLEGGFEVPGGSSHTLTIPKSSEDVSAWIDDNEQEGARALTKVEKAFGTKFTFQCVERHRLEGFTYTFPKEYPTPRSELNRLAKRAGLDRVSVGVYVTPIPGNTRERLSTGQIFADVPPSIAIQLGRRFFYNREAIQSAGRMDGRKYGKEGKGLDGYGFAVTNNSEVVVGEFKNGQIDPGTECWTFVDLCGELHLTAHGTWNVPIVTWNEEITAWSCPLNAFTFAEDSNDFHEASFTKGVDYPHLPEKYMTLLKQHFQSVKYVPGNIA